MISLNIDDRWPTRKRGRVGAQTRGQSWREAAEIIDHRDCATNSLDAAVAEAWAWLVETQKHAPERGVTHYRVLGHEDTVIGAAAGAGLISRP